ncbi:MAG: type II toxin-antitoxin system RelE/ParE family toxin [Defluviitaleaceae bacterium]|nr:type II toxin-antitoxin system RelE/ParE family toxin [Defluviitaleaceae bacterium]
MYEVFPYTDKNGKSAVMEYIRELTVKNDKGSRIKANKILSYIDYLAEYGQRAREPYAKHIDGDIWELRPLQDRILFAAWDGNKFILLHIFKKETQKTPKREIKQALRNLRDYRERSKPHE